MEISFVDFLCYPCCHSIFIYLYLRYNDANNFINNFALFSLYDDELNLRTYLPAHITGNFHGTQSYLLSISAVLDSKSRYDMI